MIWDFAVWGRNLGEKGRGFFTISRIASSLGKSMKEKSFINLPSFWGCRLVILFF